MMNYDDIRTKILEADEAENKEMEAPEEDKEYFGKKDDEYFYVSTDADGKLSIVDAEDETVIRFDEVEIPEDTESPDREFLIKAAQQTDIDNISFALLTKYDLLKLEEPEPELPPEIEDEEEEITDEEEEEELPESIKENKQKLAKYKQKYKDAENKCKQTKKEYMDYEKKYKKEMEKAKGKKSTKESVNLEESKKRLDSLRKKADEAKKRYVDYQAKMAKKATKEGIVPDSLKDDDEQLVKKLSEDAKIYKIIVKGLESREKAQEVAEQNEESAIVQDPTDPTKFAVAVIKETVPVTPEDEDKIIQGLMDKHQI